LIHIKSDIRIRNAAVRGELDVKSYKAEAMIDARSLDGTANLQTDKGSIVLRVPQDIGLEVDFSGGRRSRFHSDFPLASQVGGRLGEEVRGTVNGGGARVVLRTDKGSVSIQKKTGEL
jgi:hypothetical protein